MTEESVVGVMGSEESFSALEEASMFNGLDESVTLVHLPSMAEEVTGVDAHVSEIIRDTMECDGLLLLSDYPVGQAGGVITFLSSVPSEKPITMHLPNDKLIASVDPWVRRGVDGYARNLIDALEFLVEDLL